MDRLVCFGVGAFLAVMAAAEPAHAGLFGFGGRGCCDDDCCPEECCPDECGSEGCLTKKKGGLLKRLIGCFGKHKSLCGDDCCEVGCCDEGCCEEDCSPVGSGRAVVTDQPSAAAPVAPAESAPAPPEGPADAAEDPAEIAPPPPTDPEAYFPSHGRASV